MSYNVGIFIFDEVEVLDFAGPFEVFSTATRVKLRQKTDHDILFNVFTVASENSVLARGGLRISPNFNISNHPPINVLIIPGGIVTEELKKDFIINWISKTSSVTILTASVCTGVFLLAKTGLLKHKTVTTHWEDIDDLRSMFPDLIVKENIRWLDQDNIITSAGISAGIDMSLYLVSRLADKELALKTARQMEYDWHSQSR